MALQSYAAQSDGVQSPELGTDEVTRRPVRVLVDATNLSREVGGLRTYAVGLLGELARNEALEVVVATSRSNPFGESVGSAVTVISSDRPGALRRAFWRERKLSRLVLETRADVVLALTPELPVRPLPVPAVAVLHDVGPLVRPDIYGRARWLRYRLFLPILCRRAKKLICVSEATRRDLERCFPVTHGLIEVVPEGPQHLPRRISETPDKPYVLYVGALLPHKNVATAVEGFLRSSASSGARFVIVGPATRQQRSALARRFGAAVRAGLLDIRGFVDQEELAELYGTATVVVQPSLHEGFGLTLLEAFTAGRPVIASAQAAMKEIGGTAVMWIETPTRPDAWRDGFDSLFSDVDLQRQLTSAGSDVAGRFTWRAAGEKVAGLLLDAGATRCVV